MAEAFKRGDRVIAPAVVLVKDDGSTLPPSTAPSTAWADGRGLQKSFKPGERVIADGVVGVKDDGSVLGLLGKNGQVLTLVNGLPAWADSTGGGGGMSNPMTTLGDIITGGVAGAAQRLPVGANGQVLTVSGGVPTWAAAGAGASGLLARATYNPAVRSQYTTTSTTYAKVDGTNLLVTFTAPSSGKVIIRLSACAYGADNEVYCMWAVGPTGARDATTEMAAVSKGANNSKTRVVCDCYVTGLTGGNSYTYYWWFAAGYPGFTVGIDAGGPNNEGGGSSGPGPTIAIMDVWAA